jgi:hypothetical protein
MAIALPIPLVAPVRIAVLSVREKSEYDMAIIFRGEL